ELVRELLDDYLCPQGGGTPWDFVAIHMEQEETKRPSHALAFERQMKHLRDRVNERSPRGEPRAAYFHALGQDPKVMVAQMKKTISDRFAQFRKKADDFQAWIEEVRSGENMHVNPEKVAFLEQAGAHNAHKFLNREGIQLYQEGFVW